MLPIYGTYYQSQQSSRARPTSSPSCLGKNPRLDPKGICLPQPPSTLFSRFRKGKGGNLNVRPLSFPLTGRGREECDARPTFAHNGRAVGQSRKRRASPAGAGRSENSILPSCSRLQTTFFPRCEKALLSSRRMNYFSGGCALPVWSSVVVRCSFTSREEGGTPFCSSEISGVQVPRWSRSKNPKQASTPLGSALPEIRRAKKSQFKIGSSGAMHSFPPQFPSWQECGKGQRELGDEIRREGAATN